MKNRVLFITKPFIIEPLGIGNLSAILKEEGCVVDLIQVSNNFEKLIDEIERFKPDFLCYSIWTGGHTYFFDLNRSIKCSLTIDVISIFGGPHCTYFGDISIQEGVDYIIKGEADNALFQLIADIHDGINVPKIINVSKPPQHLDSLPWADREILYKYDKNRKNPIKSLMTSRGCPYSCTYCYNEKYEDLFEGSRVRTRDMEDVLDEALHIKTKYKETKYFFFMDDELGGKKSRIKILLESWKRDINLPFHVQMRVENINLESIRMLQESGCDSITFAIESGKYETRKNILNKKFSNELILEKVKILKDCGMRFRVENMIGIPCRDTLEDMWSTYELNLKLGATISWTSLFMPYPGTSLGNKCEKENLYDGDVDKIPDAFFDKTILKYGEEINTQLNNMQKLFSLFIFYKVPKTTAEILIKLPLFKVYRFIGFWFKSKLYNELYRI